LGFENILSRRKRKKKEFQSATGNKLEFQQNHIQIFANAAKLMERMSGGDKFVAGHIKSSEIGVRVLVPLEVGQRLSESCDVKKQQRAGWRAGELPTRQHWSSEKRVF
jgi:hypothetical protein